MLQPHDRAIMCALVLLMMAGAAVVVIAIDLLQQVEDVGEP